MPKIPVMVSRTDSGFVWIAERPDGRIRGRAVLTCAGARRAFGQFAHQIGLPRESYTYGKRLLGVPTVQTELELPV